MKQGYLQRELAALELRVAEVALALCAGALLLALGVAAFVQRGLGLWLSAFVVVLSGWFAWARSAARSGRSVEVLSRVSPFVEISLPTAVLAMDWKLVGGAYALDVPTVPQFYAVFVALQLIRLRPWLPVQVSLLGAAEYLALYAFGMAPELPVETGAAAHTPWLVVTRAAIVVLTGGVVGLVTAGLRGAVGRAESARRADELFGKYQLGERIAVGGMGEVFRALYCPEGGFARPVALKRIHARLAQEERFVSAFRSEAELCSRLLHPNIVQVVDFGKVEDTYFLAMEYVDGGTLGQLERRARLSGARVPERVVVQVGRDLLAALSYAHDTARDADGKLLRVLHRDLSPPNVLLTRAGDAKVSDFGIARALGEGGELVTATVVGKSAYMSPEQACAQPQDGRSDLFAVGIMLWELVAGRRLYARGTDAANLLAIVNEDVPPPSQYRPGLDARWDAFFARAVATDVGERFQDAEQMRGALTALLDGELPRPEEVSRFLAALPPGDGAGAPPSLVPAAREEATRPVPPPAGAQGG
ncbi:MAG: hypothetical protein RL653_3958 [Pseudomonadota bacterium]